jgi:hypothetical protein
MLRDLVLQHKDVFYGSSLVALAVSSGGSANGEQQSQVDDRSLLGRFSAVATLAHSRAERERLQILWQKASSMATAGALATAGGPRPSLLLLLLPGAGAACADLQREALGFVFDVVCLPINECIAEIATKIAEVTDCTCPSLRHAAIVLPSPPLDLPSLRRRECETSCARAALPGTARHPSLSLGCRQFVGGSMTKRVLQRLLLPRVSLTALWWPARLLCIFVSMGLHAAQEQGGR